jgi:hypothetical protein
LPIEVSGKAALPSRVLLCFEFASADALDARAVQLTAARLPFTQRPPEVDCSWHEARLRDPDGHDMPLYHVGSSRHDPPWKIAPANGGVIPRRRMRPITGASA